MRTDNREPRTENGELKAENRERRTKNRKSKNKSVIGYRLSVLSFLFSILCSPHPAFANPLLTPTAAVKELDKMADQYRVGKNLTKDDQEFNRQLKAKILRGTFNLRELARLALAKHWNALSSKKQDQFVELLTQILEERSVFAKEKAEEKGEGKSYKVVYKKEQFLNSEKTQSFVHTMVSLQKRRIHLDIDYKLKKAGAEQWQIYDVILDEASLIDNYRSSFGKIIEKNGYPELVRRMENKLKEFKAKRT